MQHAIINQWFNQSSLGFYASHQEKDFFQRFAARYAFGVSVQLGMPDWILLPECCIIRLPAQAQMEAERMAWGNDTLDLLLLPHVLECSSAPQHVLAEAWRCLKPEGRLVLTGLNPYSLWRLGNCFNGRNLPKRQACLPLPLLKRYLSNQGFHIESGCFMAYVPPVQSQHSLRMWRFMEAAGNRWWPHAAAIYGLVLVKRQAGIHPMTEQEESELTPEQCGVLTPAKIKAE